MKKLYYFTHKNLGFKEISRFKSKFSVVILSGIIICASLSILLINQFKKSDALPTNPTLKQKINLLLSNYQKVNDQLDSLLKINNELRVAANLPAISAEESKMGVGGGEFNLSVDFLNTDESNNLKKVDAFVDNLLRKIKFEKKNVEDISLALNRNEELFKDIPAIKPCEGTLGEHGFGMRFHPILHVMRMHNGIDILTNVGTPVFASGAGVVDFVGYKNGFGLCVEIDHGFGYRTIYGHLSATKAKQGQKIERNKVIAYTGNTGLSAGPHLHYEVLHDGVNLDPEHFFFDDSHLFAKN